MSTSPEIRSHTKPLLAGALIDTALAMIEERGVGELSLRGMARRAGVSHTAPLRHFDGFNDLLAAVAARGFANLTASVDDASASLAPGSGARARLVAACQRYVEVANEHPGLFGLMFRTDLIETTNPAYQRESINAHRTFLRLVRAVQDTGWHTDIDTSVANAAIWSMVHGLAVLWTTGPLRDSLGDKPDIDETVSTSLSLVLDIESRPDIEL